MTGRNEHTTAPSDTSAPDRTTTDDDRGSSDLQDVAWQIGREPRAFRDVAVRCPFGFPAVVRQHAVDHEERPFPTAYYVCCPHLVRQIDRLESGGGVRRFERRLERDAVFAGATRSEHDAHAAVHAGHRIAGCGDPMRVKCLHAHAAWAMATGTHELGLEVVREAQPIWCDTAACQQGRNGAVEGLRD